MNPIHMISVLSLAVALSACHHAVGIVPSLSPVHPTKTRKDLPKRQVTSCKSFLLHAIPTGDDPVADATTQLESTKAADGVTGVTVEQSTYFWFLGHTTCTTVSGTPFRYTSTGPVPGKKAKQPVRPPPRQRVSTPVVECSLACERFGKILENSQLLQRRAVVRCNNRCAVDRAFQTCVTRASTPQAARLCESTSP